MLILAWNSTLAYHSMKFRHFRDIFHFPIIQSLKSNYEATRIYNVYKFKSRIVIFVVKTVSDKTLKSLKILWKRLSARFPLALYVFINR